MSSLITQTQKSLIYDAETLTSITWKCPLNAYSHLFISFYTILYNLNTISQIYTTDSSLCFLFVSHYLVTRSFACFGLICKISGLCVCVSRFMATNDLMLELQKDSIKLDEDSERKVVTMLLKLLEDKNGEVQNLAVKW